MSDATATPQVITDRHYLARAFQLAEQGRFTCSPNPMVGAVIVRDGEIVGEGFHQWAGQGHAEVNAIAAAGHLCAGATIYVTLEPCNHFGKTPPCVDAILNAGMTRVVIGRSDDNPEAAGGAARLRESGVTVDFVGDWPELNHGFIARTEQQQPYVTLKLAQSIDGRTAMASGESQWITGAAARYQVQRLRAAACAVITGIGSVLADNSRLTVRVNDWLEPYPANRVRQPLRVVLDSRLRLQPKHHIAATGTLVVYAQSDDAAKQQALQASGCELLQLPNDAGQIDLPALLAWLAREKLCNTVLVEAGAVVAGAFIQARLVDELHVFQANCLMGQQARPLAALDIGQMADKLRLKRLRQRMVGDDLLEVYRFAGE